MTEVKKHSQNRYLTADEIRMVYDVFHRRSQEMEEPVPDWSFVDESEIQNLALLPQSVYYEKELYPSIEEKAAIIFYKVNKGHIFPNGNKRMSIVLLCVFLGMNGKSLAVSPSEIRDKALWLANTPAADFEAVKVDLAAWVQESMRDD